MHLYGTLKVYEFLKMEIVLEEAAVYCLLVITCSTSFIAIVFYFVMFIICYIVAH